MDLSVFVLVVVGVSCVVIVVVELFDDLLGMYFVF